MAAMDPGGAFSRKASKVCTPEDALIPHMEEDAHSADLEEPEVPAIISMKSNERLFRQRRSLTSAIALGAGLLVCGCAALACISRAHRGSRTWTLSSTGAAVQWWASLRGVDSSELAHGSCDYSMQMSCPARSLLEMPEVHEVVAQNLLRLGRRIVGPQTAPIVKTIVGVCFRNVSKQLERESLQVARELERLRFTRSQKVATLNSLRLLADPRIENIGLDIAEAITNSTMTSAAVVDLDDASTELTALLERFEVGALQADLQPVQLLWSEGRQWSLTLEFESRRSMAGVSSHWRDTIDEVEQSAEVAWGLSAAAVEEETKSAIVAGALVHARVLLDIIKVRAHSGVPARVTSLSSYLGVNQKAVSCRGSDRFLSQFACPLKFGIQGMDALRAYFSQPPQQEPLPLPPVGGPRPHPGKPVTVTEV